MKKTIFIVMAVMCLVLTACGKQNDNEEVKNDTSSEKMTSESVENESKQNDNEEVKNDISSEAMTSESVKTESNQNEQEIGVEDLTKYYDTSKFIGNPTIEHGYVIVGTNRTTGEKTYSLAISDSVEELQAQMAAGTTRHYRIDETYGVDGGEVECIIVDNGTPDDFSDDKVAYILKYIPYS